MEYDASKQQLVVRAGIDFQPGVLAKSAFLDRPRSVIELYQVVGLIEEKAAVAQGRQKIEETRRFYENMTLANSMAFPGYIRPREERR